MDAKKHTGIKWHVKPPLEEARQEPQLFQAERIVHSLKTGLACIIGLLLTKITPLSQWLIITILVVMCAQQSVGSMLQKSYMRFLGTIFGAASAILTLAVFGDSFIARGTTLILSILFFSYLATSDKSYSDAASLGAVTVIIILIAPNPTVHNGLERCFEISLGILIAGLVSQLIFPIHARTHLRYNQSATLNQLVVSYRSSFVNHHNETLEQYFSFDEAISKFISIQRKLANDAKREPFGPAFSIDYFKQSLWCEKEILRTMNLMHQVYYASPNLQKEMSHIPSLTEWHADICIALEKIAHNMTLNKPETISIPSILAAKEAIFAAANQMTSDEKKNVYTFLFGMEMLLLCLTKLAILQRGIKK